MIFFTSDFHIGDKKILASRKIFSSVSHMEEVLIENFNMRVKENDTVWLLGDMFCSVKDAIRLLTKLHGKKHYVIGNHDRKWINLMPDNMVESVHEMAIENIGGVPVTLCHYPMYEWYKAKYGGLLIHGHMHSKVIEDKTYLKYLAIDVSVEKTDYFPVSWEDIRKYCTDKGNVGNE